MNLPVTQKHFLSFSRKLFLSVISLFLVFAICFIAYQYQREREYKIELLNTKLQDYNSRLYEQLEEQPLDSEIISGYINKHILEDLRVTLIDAEGNVVDVNGNFVLGVSGDPTGKPASSNKIKISLPYESAAAAQTSDTINGNIYTINASNENEYGNVNIVFASSSNMPLGQKASAVITSSSIVVTLNSNESFSSLAELNLEMNNAITAANGGQKHSLISVNLSKLDTLHDIVGEIITTESMVIANPDLEGLELESFSKAARQLRKLTDELQDTVMSIRMVPLAGVFQKMGRIVRDMKIKLNKEAELVLEGETTEVDKSIVDNLNDPLMHLVRNCMDHGIEDDINVRIAEGKPEKGTVKLSAKHSAGEVIITVSDDGAGINCEKVLEKAKESGLLTKPESEYTTKEIQNMILLPGFSTNDTVTEYSGRGVGMDVVRSNIEQCGGTLTVESEEGKGSSFIIRIPLTLAIVEGMKLKVGSTIFTVPISSIKESLMVANNQLLHDTKQGEMIMIRGVCYPILRLHEKFNMPTEVTKLEDGILLLVDVGGKNVCLFADKLIGEQPVVVKPFPKYLSQYNIKAEGLSGCTVMGDGTISLIIDVNNLIG